MFIFEDHTLRIIALGVSILGAVSGAYGSFAVLRSQALLGDAISHAALPGIALAFILTGSKASYVLLLGAAFTGTLAAYAANHIIQNSRLKSDAALGISLSVFFGFGLVLLTWIQRFPSAAKSGLETFLFGQAANLLLRDLNLLIISGILLLIILILFWKEFKILTLDPAYGNTLGLPMNLFNYLLTAILVIAIVLGLQTVGVVLMSAMVITPAAAARQWTNRLSSMVFIAAFFGAMAGVSGAFISSSVARMPTGPVVILMLAVIFIFSFFFASPRGLLWRWIRVGRNKKRLHTEVVLKSLFELSSQHETPDGHPHSIKVIELMCSKKVDVESCLNALSRIGLARKISPQMWVITEQGWKHARELTTAFPGKTMLDKP